MPQQNIIMKFYIDSLFQFVYHPHMINPNMKPDEADHRG